MVAVQQRAEGRDYLDIDRMLTDGSIDLPTALASAMLIYGPRFNPLLTLKALSFFDDGDLGLLNQPTRDRLAKAARLDGGSEGLDGGSEGLDGGSEGLDGVTEGLEGGSEGLTVHRAVLKAAADCAYSVFSRNPPLTPASPVSAAS